MGPHTSVSTRIILSILSIIPYSACRPSTHISSLSVTSHITLRYAQTQVEALIKNPSNSAKQEEFSMFLPDSAFISFFSMTMGEEEQVAKVMAKEDAVEKFNNAKKLGIGAGLVSENERDSNKFSIKTNIEPGEKVVFKLTYEELLQRRNGQYEHSININPNSIVGDFKVEVFINESLPIANLFVPELKLTNELNFAKEAENKDAIVSHKEGTKDAHIVYSPDKAGLQKAGERGVSGEFLVRYDVDRKGQDSEVQVIDGYFVHFFAPENLQKLPKHAVFVLDISGSMMGEKIVQLKDAMFTILDDMTESDYFSIIVFSSGVHTWTSPEQESLDKDQGGDPQVIQATKHNKNIAINYVNDLQEGGGTNINEAMIAGIDLAEMATKQELLPRNTKSMLIFLTDGMPTVGESNSRNIRKNVKDRNTNKIPIFGLAFGRDSDFSLMKEISLDAESFAKRIYDGSDAAIQLEHFFSQISNPLISDLKFEYLGEIVDNSSLSKPTLSSFFEGGEYVVAGKLNNNLDKKKDMLSIVLLGEQIDGKYKKEMNICLPPRALPVNDEDSSPLPALSDPLDQESLTSSSCIPQPQYPERSAEQNFMKRLHAFVNIKQLLKREDNELIGGETPRSKALELALANNFVTELTSLVVVAEQDVTIASLQDRDSSSIDSSLRGYSYGKISLSKAYSFPTQSLTRTISLSPNTYSAHSALSVVPRSRGIFSGKGSGNVRRNYGGQRLGIGSSYPMKASLSYDTLENSMDYMDSMDPPESSSQGACSGSITLYSKTYHRGDSVTISENTEDLEPLVFTDKLVSLVVSGDCCWEVFTGVNYSGDSEQFTSTGTFTSTTSTGTVFRNNKSVRKC